MVLCETVGVFGRGQNQNFDIQVLLEQHVHALNCRLDAGLITVEQFSYVVREITNGVNVLFGECSARGGNHIFESCLVHRDYIGITFHNKAFVKLGDFTLRLRQSIDGFALVVDG